MNDIIFWVDKLDWLIRACILALLTAAWRGITISRREHRAERQADRWFAVKTAKLALAQIGSQEHADLADEIKEEIRRREGGPGVRPLGRAKSAD